MASQDINPNPDIITDAKEDFNKETEELERAGNATRPGHQFDESYKSKWEDLDRIKTLKLFWKMTLVCFAVAFSAAADGYQVSYRAYHGSSTR